MFTSGSVPGHFFQGQTESMTVRNFPTNACPDPGIQNNFIYERRRVTEIAVPRSNMALVSASVSQASNSGLALEDYSIYNQLSDDELLALAIERSLTNSPSLSGNQNQPGNQSSASRGETSGGLSSRRTGQPNGPNRANPPQNQPPEGAAAQYSSHNPPADKLFNPWVLHGLPLKDIRKLFYTFTHTFQINFFFSWMVI